MSVKVKIGRNKLPKAHFNLSHDVTTSHNFGFCQPIFCKRMEANSSMSVKMNHICRLTPMVVPTYGRVWFKTFSQFVKVKDLFYSWPNFLTGQSYGVSQNSYIPTAVPYVTTQFLSSLLFRYSTFSVYKINSDGTFSYTAQKTISSYDFNSRYVPVSSGITLPSFSSSQISISEADFVLYCKHVNSDEDRYVAIKLLNGSINLRKILMGLGYQIDFTNTREISILPLFAYFKCYFDIFAPQRSITWNDTALHKIIHLIDQNNYSNIIGNWSSLYQLFNQFIDDLAYCYYTDDPDFVSAHIINPAVSDTGIVDKVSDSAQLSTSQMGVNANQQPFMSNSFTLSRNRMLWINRVTKYVNKLTAMGGKISEIMSSLGLGTPHDNDSGFIGTSSMLLEISDINASTAYENQSLGQWAGKGKGLQEGEALKYDTKDAGFWITICCVVPEAYGYCQAIDQNLYGIGRFDAAYNEQFDALGYQITNKDVVLGSRDVVTTDEPIWNQQLGFIPRYSEMKTMSSKLLGDFSLRSTRSSMLPYTLDRFVTPEDIQMGSGSISSFTPIFTHASVPAASPEYRFVNKYPWLTNFQRMFSSQPEIDSNIANAQLYFDHQDNFFSNSFLEVHYHAHMLPLAESFDTDGSDDNAITVDKE